MCVCEFCGRDRPNTAPSSPRLWRNEKVLSGGRGRPSPFSAFVSGAHGLPGHLLLLALLFAPANVFRGSSFSELLFRYRSFRSRSLIYPATSTNSLASSGH